MPIGEKYSSGRKVIVYIAVSLDGYIARKDGDIDWLSAVNSKDEDYGYSEFLKNVDTVIIGRKTYDKVLSFGIGYPHGKFKNYIITRKKRRSSDNIEFYNGNMRKLISSLKKEKGKNVFVDGGAEIVNLFMKHNLIDEFIISVIPVFLGNGIRLFKNKRPEVKLKLESCKSFSSGLAQLHYKVI
jgi:dihydrofolate reductase